jgi:hypothetical protein
MQVYHKTAALKSKSTGLGYAPTNLIKSGITFLSARTFNQTTLPSNSIQFINENNRWSLCKQK